jgi:hypothetical protein
MTFAIQKLVCQILAELIEESQELGFYENEVLTNKGKNQ